MLASPPFPKAQPITRHASLLCGVLGLLMAIAWPQPAAAELQSDFARREAPLLKTKLVTTPSIHLTKRYKSMQGPRSIRSFQLDTESDTQRDTERHAKDNAEEREARVWIRRYKIDVLDESAGIESTEFLCHAWLMADSGERTPETGQRGARGGRDPSLFLTISQGFEDMQFPDGFGVAFDSLDVSRVGLLTMAVNNNDDEIDKQIQFRATIDYLSDSDAQQLGVKPLVGFQLHAHQRAPEAALVHQHHAESTHADHASPGHPAGHGGSMTDHWLVPSGRQVVRSDVKPGVIHSDGMIHFIKIHLHPYGESVSLIDKQTGEEVWKGYATNHAERAHLLAVESYSSVVGIPIHKDRKYELITVYDNPTDTPIDAMAVMRLYVHPTDGPPAS